MVIDWIELHKKEAAKFVSDFYRKSFDWRNNGLSSYHQKWDRWERNYHNIYDPGIRAKKEPWQSCMFVPYSVTNVEVITTSLFKLLFGKRESIRFDPREMGDELQAELHSDVLAYEMDMSGIIEESNKILKEIGIFGSAFMKVYWKKTEENRKLIEPVRRGFVGTAKSLMAGEIARPNDIIGMKQKEQRVTVEDDCRVECVHIRDIFLEPNSRNTDRILHRQKNITYGELVRMSKMKTAGGNVLIDKDSVAQLKNVSESDKFEEDMATIQLDLGNGDPTLVRTDYDKRHTCFEYWGPIPRKWINLEMPESTDEDIARANEMVPGKILVASSNYYLASEENPNPIPKPPFVKFDYIDCGQTYGKGICAIIEGLQEQGNEVTNLRIDNVALTMNKVVGVLEKHLRDTNELKWSPGAVIRIKGDIVDDARKAIFPIEMGTVDIGGYRETTEIERQIQEATAANRVTIGSAGLKQDTNQTLGGMELLRQAAYDRFAVYAFLIGNKFKEVASLIMSLSYQNSGPERNKQILGEIPLEILPNEWVPRWQAYRPLPPHEIVKRYDLKIVDIFGMENRAMKAQQLTMYGELAAKLVPGFNSRPLLERLGHYNDFKKDEVGEILGKKENALPSPRPQMPGGPVNIGPSLVPRNNDVAPAPEVPQVGA
jgi:hypothetical protein